jgi:hypothetical protein
MSRRSPDFLIRSMSGVMSGLSSMIQQATPQPLQQGRPGVLGECVNPTHCYRTVSQRSLSVPTRFTTFGTRNLSGTIYNNLMTTVGGLMGNVSSGIRSRTFNSANVQKDRQRVYDLVLIAIRSEINVQLMDEAPIGPGSINIDTLQSRLEELINQTIMLRVFHTADQKDPWIDSTNIGYFQRPRGEYQLVPPVMWTGRDPVMEISVAPPPEFTGGAPSTSFYQGLINFTRTQTVGTAMLTIECLFIPDPYSCPDAWPGHLCPRDKIGNTPDYTGQIESARRRIGRR